MPNRIIFFNYKKPNEIIFKDNVHLLITMNRKTILIS